MSLVPVDTSNAVAVSDYLSKARDWLATAVEMTGPEQIAAAKAEIATAAEATKQLGLSKEIQLDAQEMVRRAEYALGKAIRKGQEEGVIAKRGDLGGGAGLRNGGTRYSESKHLVKPSEFFASATDWHQTNIVSATDSAAFDAALTEAKAEGNLSRANIVRKVEEKSESGRPAAQRADQIASLAGRGASSEQIAREIGVRAARVREIARAHGITIRADVVRGKARRIDHDRVLDNVTEALEVAAISLRDIDPEALDRDQALERLDSLTSSISALRQAVRKIKESLHDQG